MTCMLCFKDVEANLSSIFRFSALYVNRCSRMLRQTSTASLDFRFAVGGVPRQTVVVSLDVLF